MLPTNEAVWSVDGWLQSLSLHLIVGAALQPDGGGSVDFVRGLSRDHIVTRLRADDIEGQLAAAIDAGVKALRQQEVVTAAELNSKFASEAGFEMSFGQIALFFDGLEGLIGPPLLVEGSLHKSMEREHTACDDADTCFTSSNGMTTSSRVEWEVVVSPVEGRTYPERAGLSPPMHRSVRPLQELLPHMEERNRRLLAAKHCPMCEEELLGGRLYTGPMYEKYNLVLRSRSGVAALMARRQEVCQGNEYATTLHAINSCVAKLSKLSAAGGKVWRGFCGATLPPSFWEPSADGVLGGVEFGFSSTTTARAQAVHYSKGAASTIFEMSVGMVDRGADVSWLSQYPHEKEVLYPPLLGVEVLSTSVDGSTLIVSARLSLPPVLTLERVVSKRKKVVLDLCAQIVDELRHETRGEAWTPLQRLVAPQTSPQCLEEEELCVVGGAGAGPAGARDVRAEARAWLDERLAGITRLDAAAFNDDETLRCAVRDAVVAKRSVSSWPEGLRQLCEASGLDGDGLWSASKLKLRECELEAGAAGALSKLLSAGRLHALDAATNAFGDEGSRCLAAALPCAPELRELSLKGNGIGQEGGLALGAALCDAGCRLEWLDLTKNDLGDEGAAAVGAALARNRTLTSLSLERTKCGDLTASSLGEALSANATLTELDLASEFESTRPNAIGSAGGVALAAGLSRGVTLTSLSLYQNRTLGPEAGCALAAAARACEQLRILNVLGSGQNARSVAALTEARDASPSLLTLCGIDPEELTDLSEGLNAQGLLEADALLVAADLAVNETLTALNMRENDIGDDGRSALEGAVAGRAMPLRLEL